MAIFWASSPYLFFMVPYFMLSKCHDLGLVKWHTFLFCFDTCSIILWLAMSFFALSWGRVEAGVLIQIRWCCALSVSHFMPALLPSRVMDWDILCIHWTVLRLTEIHEKMFGTFRNSLFTLHNWKSFSRMPPICSVQYLDPKATIPYAILFPFQKSKAWHSKRHVSP